jgi:hypothetical protein
MRDFFSINFLDENLQASSVIRIGHLFTEGEFNPMNKYGSCTDSVWIVYD